MSFYLCSVPQAAAIVTFLNKYIREIHTQLKAEVCLCFSCQLGKAPKKGAGILHNWPVASLIPCVPGCVSPALSSHLAGRPVGPPICAFTALSSAEENLYPLTLSQCRAPEGKVPTINLVSDSVGSTVNISQLFTGWRTEWMAHNKLLFHLYLENALIYFTFNKYQDSSCKLCNNYIIWVWYDSDQAA